MRRWLVIPTLLFALALVLAACPPVQPAAPGTPAAETPAAVELDTPTPEAAEDEDATETPDITDTEGMTETEEMTGTEDLTDTEGMTGTEEMTGASEVGTGDGAMDGMVMVTNDPVHGNILTDSQGRALYLFTQDTPNTSTCTGACLQRWPPLTVTGEPQAGTGVDEGMLGVITRDDGTQQVTYNGWPLYYYADDQAPGDTTGHEVGDVWYLVTPEGEQVGGQ